MPVGSGRVTAVPDSGRQRLMVAGHVKSKPDYGNNRVLQDNRSCLLGIWPRRRL